MQCNGKFQRTSTIDEIDGMLLTTMSSENFTPTYSILQYLTCGVSSPPHTEEKEPWAVQATPTNHCARPAANKEQQVSNANIRLALTVSQQLHRIGYPVKQYQLINYILMTSINKYIHNINLLSSYSASINPN